MSDVTERFEGGCLCGAARFVAARCGTRVQSLFYLDAADALRKALNETCARLLPGSFLAKALPMPPQPLTGQIYSSGGIFNRLSYDPSLPMMLL